MSVWTSWIILDFLAYSFFRLPMYRLTESTISSKNLILHNKVYDRDLGRRNAASSVEKTWLLFITKVFCMCDFLLCVRVSARARARARARVCVCVCVCVHFFHLQPIRFAIQGIQQIFSILILPIRVWNCCFRIWQENPPYAFEFKINFILKDDMFRLYFLAVHQCSFERNINKLFEGGYRRKKWSKMTEIIRNVFMEQHYFEYRKQWNGSAFHCIFALPTLLCRKATAKKVFLVIRTLFWKLINTCIKEKINRYFLRKVCVSFLLILTHRVSHARILTLIILSIYLYQYHFCNWDHDGRKPAAGLVEKWFVHQSQ